MGGCIYKDWEQREKKPSDCTCVFRYVCSMTVEIFWRNPRYPRKCWKHFHSKLSPIFEETFFWWSICFRSFVVKSYVMRQVNGHFVLQKWYQSSKVCLGSWIILYSFKFYNIILSPLTRHHTLQSIAYLTENSKERLSEV